MSKRFTWRWFERIVADVCEKKLLRAMRQISAARQHLTGLILLAWRWDCLTWAEALGELVAIGYSVKDAGKLLSDGA